MKSFSTRLLRHLGQAPSRQVFRVFRGHLHEGPAGHILPDAGLPDVDQRAVRVATSMRWRHANSRLARQTTVVDATAAIKRCNR